MSDTYLNKKTSETLVQDDATPRITVSDQNISLMRQEKQEKIQNYQNVKVDPLNGQ